MTARQEKVPAQAGRPGKSRPAIVSVISGLLAGALVTALAFVIAGNVSSGGSPETVVPFYGEHQAGIETPPQSFLYFAAFDLTTTKPEDLKTLFQDWTAAAAKLTKGESLGDAAIDALPPGDTGEAASLGPSKLTVTFGAGPSLFDTRFGLADKRPEALVDIPAFNFDALRVEWTGGDLAIQACADDPQVAFHAIRNLTRIARGKAVLRWVQHGFRETAAAEKGKGADTGTPRNLQGFRDGTVQPEVAQPAVAEQVLWAASGDGQDWMNGGSYLVMRRIRMLVEVWDRSSLGDQEATIGRERASGAPIGGSGELDEPDFDAADSTGTPVIAQDAHIRRARGDGSNNFLRRPFSYADGIDSRTGQLDAGLLFISYQRDPRKQFIPMQSRLAEMDALNEYIQHVGSAIFAMFPGVQEGDFLGSGLFRD